MEDAAKGKAKRCGAGKTAEAEVGAVANRNRGKGRRPGEEARNSERGVRGGKRVTENTPQREAGGQGRNKQGKDA